MSRGLKTTFLVHAFVCLAFGVKYAHGWLVIFLVGGVMGQIDWVTLTNWIISGVIGLGMGILGGWVTYRYQRKLDMSRWEREEKQRQHEAIVEKLTKGLDKPSETIDDLTKGMERIRLELIRYISPGRATTSSVMPSSMNTILAYERLIYLLEGKGELSKNDFRKRLETYVKSRHIDPERIQLYLDSLFEELEQK